MRGESQGAHWADAEFHRVQARTLIDRGDAVEEAEARLMQSLKVARRQDKPEREEVDFEGASSARSTRRRCRHELQDLQEAKALLDELA